MNRFKSLQYWTFTSRGRQIAQDASLLPYYAFHSLYLVLAVLIYSLADQQELSLNDLLIPDAIGSVVKSRSRA